MSSDAVVLCCAGMAAVHVAGTTIFHWAGIGSGDGEVAALHHSISRKADVLNRWLTARVLIIDEISMLDGRVFDKLERLARIIRGNSLPFGGIQLVVSGDFFQLPPVSNHSSGSGSGGSSSFSRSNSAPNGGGGGPAVFGRQALIKAAMADAHARSTAHSVPLLNVTKPSHSAFGAAVPGVSSGTGVAGALFAFESAAWSACFKAPCMIELKHVYRQQEDVAFASALAELRRGQCSSQTEALLNRRGE